MGGSLFRPGDCECEGSESLTEGRCIVHSGGVRYICHSAAERDDSWSLPSRIFTYIVNFGSTLGVGTREQVRQ